MKKIKEDLKHLYNEIDARLDYYVNASWELTEEENIELCKLFSYQEALGKVLKKLKIEGS